MHRWSLKWIVGCAGPLILAMVNISPKKAGSNISAWAKVFGWENPPPWVTAPSADTWGMWIGVALIFVVVVWVTWPIGSFLLV